VFLTPSNPKDGGTNHKRANKEQNIMAVPKMHKKVPIGQCILTGCLNFFCKITIRQKYNKCTTMIKHLARYKPEIKVIG
jgi:hypothetical protein